MPESTAAPQASRIAIKFGAPSSSSTKPINGARKPQPTSALGKRQRPNALGRDPESDDEDGFDGRREVVTSLGDDVPRHEAKRRGTQTSKAGTTDAPFVITGHQNRDWKADVKAQRQRHNGGQAQRGNDLKETEPADQDKPIKWGLTVTQKAPQEGHPEGEFDAGIDEAARENATVPHPQDTAPPLDSDRDEALDALLGKKDPTKDLVIKESSQSSKPTGFSEDDAYRKMMQEAAEVSTIEEYNQIPEGEFGAAMLRGMGWKGEDGGSKPKEVKRRPHLLGLGSKEDEEIKKAELAKKNGYRERRPRLDEYRRDREKQKLDREDRRRDSYKAERDRERRDHGYDDRYGGRHRDRDSHRHRPRDDRR